MMKWFIFDDDFYAASARIPLHSREEVTRRRRTAMIPSDRKRRLFLFFCVCVAFFSSSSFFCSSSSRASDDAFDFDDGVGGVYDVEEEEERQQKRRRILRTIVNEDKTRTMIPPKWARARNENDLETDRKYVLKNMHDDGANNNGRGEKQNVDEKSESLREL